MTPGKWCALTASRARGKALVAAYKNGNGTAYNYEYDANGNITLITKCSQSFTYEYDSANQLVRENLYYGSGNSKSPPLRRRRKCS